MARFKIGSRWVGSGEALYVIAEAGVNHENNLDTALQMVDAAAAAGADAIKFQSYRAGSLASSHSPAYWDRSKEPAGSQFELFQRYDGLRAKDYRALARRAADRGIEFLTTCFDEEFVDELSDVIPAFKVASADITHHPLLRRIAATGKPVLLSVGAATLGEIDEAVRLLRSEGCSDIALLHCVLNYPCPPEAANLNAISALGRVFPDVVVGYSDHVPPLPGLIQLSAARMLGASVVEKHFTLDKTLPGNDHYHAMDSTDLRSFRGQLASLELLLGDGQVGYRASQAQARQFARRSLVAARKLQAGEPVTREMLSIKRPGTGIAPQFLDLLIGARPLKVIEEDSILQWDMFLRR